MTVVNGFKKKLLQLITLNITSREIALGVAVGVFIGTTPLYGLHTLLAIVLAMFIPRTNKIAILLGSNISIPPTAPFISWTGYQIGRMILGKSYPAIHWSILKHFTYGDIINLLYPLFLGSIVLGIAGAFMFYGITLYLVTKIRAR